MIIMNSILLDKLHLLETKNAVKDGEITLKN